MLARRGFQYQLSSKCKLVTEKRFWSRSFERYTSLSLTLYGDKSKLSVKYSVQATDTIIIRLSFPLRYTTRSDSKLTTTWLEIMYGYPFKRLGNTFVCQNISKLLFPIEIGNKGRQRRWNFPFSKKLLPCFHSHCGFWRKGKRLPVESSEDTSHLSGDQRTHKHLPQPWKINIYV